MNSSVSGTPVLSLWRGSKRKRKVSGSRPRLKIPRSVAHCEVPAPGADPADSFNALSTLLTIAIFARPLAEAQDLLAQAQAGADVIVNYVTDLAAADSVAEDALVGTGVGITALAIDADGTDSVTYALSDSAGGLFSIDANSPPALSESA